MDQVSYPSTGACWLNCGRTGKFVKTFTVGDLEPMPMYLCRWCKGALTRTRTRIGAPSAT